VSNNSPRFGFATIIGALALLAVAGCGTPSESLSDPLLEVAVILPAPTNTQAELVRNGVTQGAAANGLSIGLDSDGMTEPEQVTAIEEAAILGLDGIIIQPAGPAINTALTSARDRGMTIVQLGGESQIPAAQFWINIDDCLIGQALGQWVQGYIVDGRTQGADTHFLRVIDGTTKPQCRDAAFLATQGISETSGGERTPDGFPRAGAFVGDLSSPFTIPCTILHQGDPVTTVEQIRQCTMDHPEINIAYASSEELARLAGDGMRFAGKTIGVEVSLVATGAGKEGMELAQGTWIDALARPSYFAEGYEATGALRALHEDSPIENSTNLPYRNAGLTLCTDAPYTSVYVVLPVGLQQCWQDLHSGR